LAKRLSEKEKTDLVKDFTNSNTIEDLTKKYNCSKLTIVRNLKRRLGEETYIKLINNTKEKRQSGAVKQNINLAENKNVQKEYSPAKSTSEDLFELSPFIEIAPLNCEIENSVQRDLSSVPISDIDLPDVVYMIVDKKIELETKYLRDYPEWEFLSKEELNRKTIEIFFDLKIAKRFCNKEQKVIKVPNTKVFKIVAPILLQRGISRIVGAGKLISL